MKMELDGMNDEMDFISTLPQFPSLSGVPFNHRWELLRPTIEHLYLYSNKSLSDIMQTLKEKCGFDAPEHSYKYYINKKWKLKKNIPASKKIAMLKIYKSRAALGKPTNIRFHGHDVDFKKLRRELKNEHRKQLTLKFDPGLKEQLVKAAGELMSSFTTNILVGWNVPHGVMGHSARDFISLDMPFPRSRASTPSDFMVTTPPPESAVVLLQPTSSLSIALQQREAIDRAYMFLEGRHEELLRSVNTREKRIISSWLYQFWLFSYKSAKSFGRGPRNWTADMLRFDQYTAEKSTVLPSGDSPLELYHWDGLWPDDQQRPYYDAPSSTFPSSLCCWTIHTDDWEYESLPSEDEVSSRDPDDETTWREWPKTWRDIPIQTKLRDALAQNTFSKIDHADLPMNLSHVLTSREESPEDLVRESLVFAIMAGNEYLVDELLGQIMELKLDITNLDIIHLAATYLNGAKTCCNILARLFDLQLLPDAWSRSNDLGHTLLDTLMVTIIKNHTSCPPGVVEERWKKETRFPGDEVSICGRWGPDSAYILARRGSETGIPLEWKHKFCHTSAQTILHCIQLAPRMFLQDSALFLSHCTACGLKLQSKPLHTAIRVSLLLALHGLDDEDLFGMVAVVLCLLKDGECPLDAVEVPVATKELGESAEGCLHEFLTPFELAVNYETVFAGQWSQRVQIGWEIIVIILQRAQMQWERSRSEDSNKEERTPSEPSEESENSIFAASVPKDGFASTDCENISIASSSENSWLLDLDDMALCLFCGVDVGHSNYFGLDRELGRVWAAVQTELLTYRRLAEGDSWTSENFSMSAVRDYLCEGGELSIGLVEKGLMKEHKGCGIFGRALDIPMAEHVSTCHLTNLEDGAEGRCTFIISPNYWWNPRESYC